MEENPGKFKITAKEIQLLDCGYFLIIPAICNGVVGFCRWCCCWLLVLVVGVVVVVGGGVGVVVGGGVVLPVVFLFLDGRSLLQCQCNGNTTNNQ